MILDSETPALHRSDLVVRPRLRRTPVGTQCPNAVLDDSRRLDDVAAGRFAIVTSTDPSAAQRAAIAGHGAVLITTRPGSELHHWLRRAQRRRMVVGWDGAVLGANQDLSRPCDLLPRFDTMLGDVGGRPDRPGRDPSM